VPIQVHHSVYDSRPPWEYDEAELVSLCPACHQQLHEVFKVFRAFISRTNATNAKAFTGLLKLMLDKYGETGTIEKMARLLQ
jgi:hypothetical protein